MSDTTERLFPAATADQIRDAARHCRFASRAGADDDWDHSHAVDARRATAALGWSWDFSTWSHAASILESEADRADEG